MHFFRQPIEFCPLSPHLQIPLKLSSLKSLSTEIIYVLNRVQWIKIYLDIVKTIFRWWRINQSVGHHSRKHRILLYICKINCLLGLFKINLSLFCSAQSNRKFGHKHNFWMHSTPSRNLFLSVDLPACLPKLAIRFIFSF